MTLDDRVYEYTADFCKRTDAEVDLVALRNGIKRHLDAARQVVTNETLERLGHQHLAVMINTAARYSLSLGEVMMEGVREGTKTTGILCDLVNAKAVRAVKIPMKPRLRIVKN